MRKILVLVLMLVVAGGLAAASGDREPLAMLEGPDREPYPGAPLLAPRSASLPQGLHIASGWQVDTIIAQPDPCPGIPNSTFSRSWQVFPMTSGEIYFTAICGVASTNQPTSGLFRSAGGVVEPVVVPGFVTPSLTVARVDYNFAADPGGMVAIVVGAMNGESTLLRIHGNTIEEVARGTDKDEATGTWLAPPAPYPFNGGSGVVAAISQSGTIAYSLFNADVARVMWNESAPKLISMVPDNVPAPFQNGVADVSDAGQVAAWVNFGTYAHHVDKLVTRDASGNLETKWSPENPFVYGNWEFSSGPYHGQNFFDETLSLRVLGTAEHTTVEGSLELGLYKLSEGLVEAIIVNGDVFPGGSTCNFGMNCQAEPVAQSDDVTVLLSDREYFRSGGLDRLVYESGNSGVTITWNAALLGAIQTFTDYSLWRIEWVPGPGTIEGTVVRDGALAPDVSVEVARLSEPGPPQVWQQKTGADGTFAFVGLPSGIYRVRAQGTSPYNGDIYQDVYPANHFLFVNGVNPDVNLAGINGSRDRACIGPFDFDPKPARPLGIGATSRPNLLFITHGWNQDPELPDWAGNLAIASRSRLADLGVSTEWDVIVYDWRPHAGGTIPPTGSPSCIGFGLANDLAVYQHIHFIGHSAGSWLINSASVGLHSITSGQTRHLTFLDAYTPWGAESYFGGFAQWSEHYFKSNGPIQPLELLVPPTWFDEDAEPPQTQDRFGNAFNVDLTGTYPGNACLSPFEPKPWKCAMDDGHGWPIQWYIESITDPGSSHGGWGFGLSKEVTGQLPRHTDLDGCGSDAVVVSCARGNGIRIDSMGNLSPLSGNTPAEPDFNEVLPIEGFDSHSSTGTVDEFPGGLRLWTGSPVWVEQTITVPATANVLKFDARLIEGAGELTVFLGETAVFGRTLYADAEWASMLIPVADYTLWPGVALRIMLSSANDSPAAIEIRDFVFGTLQDSPTGTTDADCDTDVDVSDAVLVLGVVAALVDESDMCNLDADQSGDVTSADSLLILRTIAGFIP